MKSDQHRALAIEADHTLIANTTLVGLVMMLVRALTRINPKTTSTTNPLRKLKMQLLVFYAIPAFFIFGASSIILLAMYLCIFEMVLRLVKK